MSNFQNDVWAEEQKEQIATALLHKDYCMAQTLDEELINGVGYGMDFSEILETKDNYEAI